MRLGAEDTVTCTYSNRLVPPDGHLVLAKQTLGATGSFPFAVTGPKRATQTLTTHRVGVPVTGTPIALPGGTYRVSERLPKPSSAGKWSVMGVICNGAKRKPAVSTSVKVTAAQGAYCLFRNRFTPAGSIRLKRSRWAASAPPCSGSARCSGRPRSTASARPTTGSASRCSPPATTPATWRSAATRSPSRRPSNRPASTGFSTTSFAMGDRWPVPGARRRSSSPAATRTPTAHS